MEVKPCGYLQAVDSLEQVALEWLRIHQAQLRYVAARGARNGAATALHHVSEHCRVLRLALLLLLLLCGMASSVDSGALVLDMGGVRHSGGAPRGPAYVAAAGLLRALSLHLLHCKPGTGTRGDDRFYIVQT